MKALVGIVTLSLLVCSSMALGQVGFFDPSLSASSYSYHGGSARAMAMGYAFVGLANDVSSGLWNPAGLWILEKPMISGSYNLYSPAGEFSYNFGTGPVQNDLNINAIGHFSFVAPVRIKSHPFTFNFNYVRTNEFTEKSAFLSDLGGRLNPDTFFEQTNFLRSFGIGAGTRIYKQLSFGFTLNIYDGYQIETSVVNSVRDSVINEVYGIVVEKFTSDELIDSTVSNGFNFTLGLMMKDEKYSVGAVARTPFTIQHTSDLSEFVVTTENGLPSVAGSDTIYVMDNKSKQDIPLSIDVGVGFFPTENLTLTLDANFQNYGSTSWFEGTEWSISVSGERNDVYEEIPLDWNNTLGAGLGAEYLVDAGFIKGLIPLRAGVRFDQLPKPKTFTIVRSNVGYDSNQQPYEMPVVGITRRAEDRQNLTSFSLGTGAHWSLINLDFAYRFSTGAELVVNQTLITYDENDPATPFTDEVDRKWKQTTHEFRFTFTGYF